MKKIIFTVAGLLLITLVMAQTATPELVSSSGDSFKNTTYQLDWSIGESVTETFSGGDFILTQGFHQSNYEIIGLENLNDDRISILVYPNPATDLISVEFKNSPFTGHIGDLIITDINGSILQSKTVLSNIEQFNFTYYAKGVYFIHLRQDNQSIKSFKIIKN